MFNESCQHIQTSAKLQKIINAHILINKESAFIPFFFLHRSQGSIATDDQLIMGAMFLFLQTLSAAAGIDLYL